MQPDSLRLPFLFVLLPPTTHSSTLARRTNSLVCDPHTPDSSPAFETDCDGLRHSLASTTPSITSTLFTWNSPTGTSFARGTCVLDIDYEPQSPLFQDFTRSKFRELVYDVDTIMFQCVYASGVGGRIGIRGGSLALRDQGLRLAGGSTGTDSVISGESGRNPENGTSSNRDPVLVPVSSESATNRELARDEEPSGNRAPPPSEPASYPLDPGLSISSSNPGEAPEPSSHPLEVNSHPILQAFTDDSAYSSSNTSNALSTTILSTSRSLRQMICRTCVQCWENDHLWQRVVTPVATALVASIAVSKASSRAAQQEEAQNTIHEDLNAYRNRYPYCKWDPQYGFVQAQGGDDAERRNSFSNIFRDGRNPFGP